MTSETPQGSETIVLGTQVRKFYGNILSRSFSYHSVHILLSIKYSNFALKGTVDSANVSSVTGIGLTVMFFNVSHFLDILAIFSTHSSSGILGITSKITTFRINTTKPIPSHMNLMRASP